MTAKSIVDKIATSSSYKAICKRIAGVLSDDLFHEVIIILYEMPEKKVLKAENEGYIEGLFVKIASIQFNKSKSDFFKKYRKNNGIFEDATYINDLSDNENDSFKEEMLNFIEEELSYFSSREDWFNKTLLKEVFVEGIRGLSRQTGIPKSVIHNEVTAYKRELIKKYEQLRDSGNL